jgi:mannose-1-phosphate guanylyltransferase
VTRRGGPDRRYPHDRSSQAMLQVRVPRRYATWITGTLRPPIPEKETAVYSLPIGGHASSDCAAKPYSGGDDRRGAVRHFDTCPLIAGAGSGVDSMKAMILAAGKGTRLGNLGADTPKPMLPLAGRPLLEWTLESLRLAEVHDVVINLHHAAQVIPGHFGDGSAFGVKIDYVFEPQILGTAGAVRNARHLLDGERFLLIYGDTVLDWDPRPMVRDHIQASAAATIVVAEVADPSRLGVVVFDKQRRITRFAEKPGHRPDLGHWVNAGLCVLERRVVDQIPEIGFSDFGTSIFPSMLERGERLQAYPRPRPLTVVDTPEQLALAQQAWDKPP